MRDYWNRAAAEWEARVGDTRDGNRWPHFGVVLRALAISTPEGMGGRFDPAAFAVID